MKKLAFIIMVLFIAALPAVTATKAIPKKTVSKPKPAAVKPAARQPLEWAAKVNGDIISMSLFNKRVDAAVKEISKYTSLEAAGAKVLIKDTKKSILEQMIEAVILYQWAEREGIEIKDKTVKARISQLKKSFPTAYEFHKSLAEQGLTPDDLERDIRRQMIAEKLMTMRANALAVTDEETKAYFDRSLELSAQKEKVPPKEKKFSEEKDDIRKFLLKEKSRTQYLKDLDEEKANAKIILNEKLGELFPPVTSQEAAPRP